MRCERSCCDRLCYKKMYCETMCCAEMYCEEMCCVRSCCFTNNYEGKVVDRSYTIAYLLSSIIGTENMYI